MGAEKQSIKSGRGGKRDGAGRPKGALDEGNAALRELIIRAVDELGGVEYLKTTALSHPAAFLALVGKVLPLTIEGGKKPVSFNFTVSAPAWTPKP